MWIQTKVTDKRERTKLITQLGIQDQKVGYESKVALAKGGYVMPLVTYIHYHSEILKLLEKDDLTPEKISEVREKNKSLLEYYEEKL